MCSTGWAGDGVRALWTPGRACVLQLIECRPLRTTTAVVRLTDPFQPMIGTDLTSVLPNAPRLLVAGSFTFYSESNSEVCQHVGRSLAAIDRLILLTGGALGVAGVITNSFGNALHSRANGEQIFHVLPRGEVSDHQRQVQHGITVFAGESWSERAVLLGQLCTMCLVLEGGPGAVEEARSAAEHNAAVIPIGLTGGAAADFMREMDRPDYATPEDWSNLSSSQTAPSVVGNSVFRIL